MNGLHGPAALLALGLLAVAQRRDHARWLLLVLPFGVAGGVGLARLVPSEAAVLPALAAGMTLAGLVSALGIRVPRALLLVLGGALTGALGYANGVGIDGQVTDWPLYATGVVATGTMLGTLSIALVTESRDLVPWAPLAHRVAASWVAAAGGISFGLTLMH